MAILLNDAFTTATSQNIGAYNSDYVRWLGTTEQLTVDATDDRVESTETGEFGFLWNNGASPTGTYEVRATGFTNRSGEGPAIQVRCDSASGGNGYWVVFLSGSAPDLYRYDNGTFNYLGNFSGAGNVPNGTSFTMRVRVSNNGSNNVEIQCQLNTGTTVTLTDTAANRKLTGRPGLTIYRTGGVANDIWIDDFVVDDLLTSSTLSTTIAARLLQTQTAGVGVRALLTAVNSLTATIRGTLRATVTAAVGVTALLASGATLPFEDLFGEHGGTDRDIDAYPAAAPRYQYVTSGATTGLLVRSATSDVINNTPTINQNLHCIWTGSARPGPGGAQYSEIEVTISTNGNTVGEVYTRLNTSDQGYGGYAQPTAVTLFHWDGTTGSFNALTSGAVSLTSGQTYRLWMYSEDEGGGVRIRMGVVGVGQIINFLHNAGLTRWTGGFPGFGFFRADGAAPLNPITAFRVNNIPPGTGSLTSAIAARLLRTQTSAVGVRGTLRRTVTAAATLGARLRFTGTAAVGVRALLNSSTTLTAGVRATLRATVQASVGIRGRVGASSTLTTNVTARLRATRTLVIGLQARIGTSVVQDPKSPGFWVAMADASGNRIPGSEISLSPRPTDVDYPRENLSTKIETADGRVVIQQPTRDSRSRAWIWTGYPADLPGYVTLWDFLQGLRSRYRRNFGAGTPYVYLLDNLSGELRRQITITGTATSGSTTVLTDTGANFPILENWRIELVAGPGAGQGRIISTNTSNTVVPQTPWTTAPGVGTQYAIHGWVSDWVKARVIDLSRVLRTGGGPARYEETRMTFVLDGDSTWTTLG